MWFFNEGFFFVKIVSIVWSIDIYTANADILNVDAPLPNENVDEIPSYPDNVIVDQSSHIFASYNESNDHWQIIKNVGSRNWWDDKTIVAQAKFDNEQQKTGWMYLNVETRGEFDDKKQAYGAGLLEGYLTGIYIVEQYKEMYGNDICKSKPETCAWLKAKIGNNKNWVDE